jgi:hypothetical protein
MPLSRLSLPSFVSGQVWPLLALMVVGSLPLAGAELPPETPTWFVTLAGAAAETFTVTVTAS